MTESKQLALPSLVKWLREHKLQCAGGVWFTGMAGTLAHNWSQPNIPWDLKIVHARMYAQGLTLLAVVVVMALENYEKKSSGGDNGDGYRRIPDFLQKQPKDYY